MNTKDQEAKALWPNSYDPNELYDNGYTREQIINWYITNPELYHDNGEE